MDEGPQSRLADITLQAFTEWLQKTDDSVWKSGLPRWVLRRTADAVILHCKIQEGGAGSSEKPDSNHGKTNHETEASCSQADKEQEQGHGNGGQNGEANGGQVLAARSKTKKGKKKGKAKAEDAGRLLKGGRQWEWDLQDFAPGSAVAKFDDSRLTLSFVHESIKLAVSEYEALDARDPLHIHIPEHEAELLHFTVDLLIRMIRPIGMVDASKHEWSKEPLTYLLNVISFLISTSHLYTFSRGYVIAHAGPAVAFLLADLMPLMGGLPDDTDPEDRAQRATFRGCTALLHYMVDGPWCEIEGGAIGGIMTISRIGLGSRLVELASRYAQHQHGSHTKTPIAVIHLVGVLMALMMQSSPLCEREGEGKNPAHYVWPEVSVLSHCLPPLLSSISGNNKENEDGGDPASCARALLHVVESLEIFEDMSATPCTICAGFVESCRPRMHMAKATLLRLAECKTETLLVTSCDMGALTDWSFIFMNLLGGSTIADFEACGDGSWKPTDCLKTLLVAFDRLIGDSKLDEDLVVETACNVLKCVVAWPGVELSTRVASLPETTMGTLLLAITRAGTCRGVNAVLEAVKFLLLTDGPNLTQSFVKAGGMFPVFCMLAGYQDSLRPSFKPSMTTLAEACGLLSEVLGAADEAIIPAFKVLMKEGHDAPSPSGLSPEQLAACREKAKVGRQVFFNNMAALLEAGLQGHDGLSAEECDCEHPCSCPPSRELVITVASHVVGALVGDDPANIRAAQQAGMIPLLLNVMEKRRLDPMDWAVTSLDDLAFAKGGTDRMTLHPEFTANAGPFRLARLAANVRNDPAVLQEDTGGGHPMTSSLLSKTISLLCRVLKIAEVPPDLRQSISSTGACDVIAEFLQFQVDRNMDIVLGAMMCLGCCERMDDVTSRRIQARAETTMKRVVPYLKSHFGILRDGSKMLDTAKCEKMAPLSTGLRLLVRVPQYKAVMQGDKDLEKLLEHLIAAAKRNPGRAPCQVPGCKACVGPSNEQAIQDMSAVRRLIHVRADKVNRPAPMDETEKAEAEKAAEKAAKELFDLLEAEEKEKNEKEGKAAKKKKNKQKGKAEEVQPAADDASNSVQQKIPTEPAGSDRAPSPASSVRSETSPRLAYDVAGASGGLGALGFFSEEAVPAAFDAGKLADALRGTPPQKPAGGNEKPSGLGTRAVAGGSDPLSPDGEWVMADRKKRPAAARKAAATVQADNPAGTRQPPQASHTGHGVTNKAVAPSERTTTSMGLERPRPRPADAAAYLRTAHRPVPPNFAAAVAAAAAAAAVAPPVAPPVNDAAPVLDGPWPLPADAFLPAPHRPAPLNFAAAAAAAVAADDADLRMVVEPPVPAQASGHRAAPGTESPGAAPMGTPVLDVFAALTLQPRPLPTAADGSDVSGPTTPLGAGPQRRGALQVDLGAGSAPPEGPQQPVSPSPITPREPWGRRPGPPPPATSSGAPPVPKMTPPGPRPPSVMASQAAPPGPPVYTAPGPRPGALASAAVPPGPPVPATGVPVRPAWGVPGLDGLPAPPSWATVPPAPEDTGTPTVDSPLLPTARPKPRRNRELLQAADQGLPHAATESGAVQAPRPPGPAPWSQVGMLPPGPRVPADPARLPQHLPTPPGPRVPVGGGVPAVVTANAAVAAAPANIVPVPSGRPAVSAQQPRPPGPRVGGRAPAPPGFAGPSRLPDASPPTASPPSYPTESIATTAAAPVPVAAVPSQESGHTAGNAVVGGTVQGAPASVKEKGGNRPEPSLDALMPMFTCPLSKVVMRDPVLAVDGYSYERAAISEFLRTSASRRSPMVPQIELTYRLVPNINLLGFIKETLGH